MTKCWFCSTPLIWSADFSFEDYCIESEIDGVVAVLTCPNCRATAEFYSAMDDEE